MKHRRPNPMAKDLFHPKYAPRVVPSKKQKSAERMRSPKHKNTEDD